jgi:hypothetical protein
MSAMGDLAFCHSSPDRTPNALTEPWSLLGQRGGYAPASSGKAVDNRVISILGFSNRCSESLGLGPSWKEER